MEYRKKFLSLLGAAALFSTLGVFVRYLSNYFGDTSIVFLRYFCSILLLTVVMKARKISFNLDWSNSSKLGLVMFLLGTPISTLAFTLSVLMIKVTSTVFYLYVASFFASFLIGKFFFHERVTKVKVIGLLIAFTGLMIFSYPIDTALNIGVILGMISGLGDTVLYTGRKMLGKVNGFTLQYYQHASSIAVTLIAAMVFGETLVHNTPTLSTLVVIVTLGVVQFLLSASLIYGFDKFPINQGTIIVSGELGFALIVNSLVLHEVPTNNEWVGAALMFLAIFIVNYWSSEKAKE